MIENATTCRPIGIIIQPDPSRRVSFHIPGTRERKKIGIGSVMAGRSHQPQPAVSGRAGRHLRAALHSGCSGGRRGAGSPARIDIGAQIISQAAYPLHPVSSPYNIVSL